MRTLSTPHIQLWQPTLYFFAFLIALRLASSGTAVLSFVLLAVYAFRGRRQAIHALMLVWLFTMINSGIAPSPPATSLLRYIVLFSAAASVFMRSGFARGRVGLRLPEFLTLLIGLFIVAHSLVVSPEPIVSILKGISWTLAFMTSISAWGALSADERSKVAKEIFLILLVVAVASLLLVPLSQGYMVRSGGGLFRGFLGHSQSLGATLALLATWATALYLQRASWIYLVCLGLVLPLIFLTGARTALLAGLLGVTFSLLLTPVLSGRNILNVAPALLGAKLWGAVFGGLVAAFIIIDPISAQVDSFINKGRDFDNVVEAYEDSRGGLIDRMLVNIYENPIEGIGFGIASDPNDIVVQRVAGIPVSATVEKGIAPIATLEELGIPGALLAAIWLWVLIVKGAHSGLAPLAVTGTILALNMGEATLFSPGGMGMLSIVLMGWTLSAARFRKRSRKMP
jgi:hypothetical protein